MSGLVHLFLAFFLAIFLERSACVASRLKYFNDIQASNLTVETIQKYLGTINKPAVVTIKSPDGDIIDCIDQWKQPAFDHPLLKNHSLQLVPTAMPRVKKDNHVSKGRNEESVVMTGGRDGWQVWHRNGTSCPEGTVPIRRTTVADVLRAQSLSHLGKKQPSVALARHNNITSPALASTGHEYAVGFVNPTTAGYGTAATISVWNPSVETDDEFSLSQVWVTAGSVSGSDLDTVEAGWQVFPGLYGDRRCRFFVYWTADGYQSTGCYNLQCSGFVQVDKNIAVGAAIDPVSTISGELREITLTIFKDPRTENWWLSYGGTSVGYWPSNLFTRLSTAATMVEWGGEVVNTKSSGGHTSTQMGSGRFAQEGYDKASYFRNIGLVDSNNNLNPVQETVTPRADASNCYNINLIPANNDWGVHFYYGGPGRNPNCP